jgi:predicted TIM-barrel fold metal-dependent hydrolase
MLHATEPIGHPYPGKGSSTPERMYEFLSAYPEQPIALAHWGGGLPFYELMPEVQAVAANVWYDSAASLYLYRPEVFALAARAAGARKLLWASDFPLIAQRRMLAYARASGLADAELAMALGGNAAAFLGRAEPDASARLP